MKHGQISRNTAKAFFAFAALAIVGACADNTTAPTSAGAAVFAPANFSKVGNTIVFRVNNAQGITQRLGKNLIDIPANAICDLGSGYGPTFWDQDCTPLAGSIVITATIMEDGDGMPYVDFQPAMRFAKDKQVMLFLRQGGNADKRQLSVLWCNNLGACVDESLTDSALKAYRVGKSPIIARRVKHFSGFLISAGEACGSLGDDFGCGVTRRSGYMVASGEDVSDVLKDHDDDRHEKQQ